jgi:hypothetical protein
VKQVKIVFATFIILEPPLYGFIKASGWFNANPASRHHNTSKDGSKPQTHFGQVSATPE